LDGFDARREDFAVLWACARGIAGIPFGGYPDAVPTVKGARRQPEPATLCRAVRFCLEIRRKPVGRRRKKRVQLDQVE